MTAPLKNLASICTTCGAWWGWQSKEVPANQRAAFRKTVGDRPHRALIEVEDGANMQAEWECECPRPAPPTADQVTLL